MRIHEGSFFLLSQMLGDARIRYKKYNTSASTTYMISIEDCKVLSDPELTR